MSNTNALDPNTTGFIGDWTRCPSCGVQHTGTCRWNQTAPYTPPPFVAVDRTPEIIARLDRLITLMEKLNTRYEGC